MDGTDTGQCLAVRFGIIVVEYFSRFNLYGKL